MKTLNLFPPLAAQITNDKTSSVRLGVRLDYEVGEVIILTAGWEKEKATPLYRAIITRLTICQIKNLIVCDLIGENESIKSAGVRGICEILGIIYKTIVSPDALVTIIEWEYLDSGER